MKNVAFWLVKMFAVGLALSGCAGVPKDAPEELHSAHKAIKHAKDVDADDFVPKTMKLAKDKLDHAVNLFKDSRKPKGEAEGALAESKMEAVRARTMAENAATLREDVRRWDGSDLSAYVDLKRAESELNAARSELHQRPTTQEIPSAQPAPLGLKESIVYFRTNDAHLREALAASLDDLVRVMKEHADLTVELTGHADRRGSDQLNDKLSRNRAESVAQYLESQGIKRERIQISARGARDAVAHARDPGALQLDRRVDAEVRNVAH